MVIHSRDIHSYLLDVENPSLFLLVGLQDSENFLSFLALPVVFASPPHRLMDHDTYSAHDLIGKVYICLNPLADGGGAPSSSTLDGWFPIFDTLHGERDTHWLDVHCLPPS